MKHLLEHVLVSLHLMKHLLEHVLVSLDVVLALMELIFRPKTIRKAVEVLIEKLRKSGTAIRHSMWLGRTPTDDSPGSSPWLAGPLSIFFISVVRASVRAQEYLLSHFISVVPVWVIAIVVGFPYVMSALLALFSCVIWGRDVLRVLRILVVEIRKAPKGQYWKHCKSEIETISLSSKFKYGSLFQPVSIGQSSVTVVFREAYVRLRGLEFWIFWPMSVFLFSLTFILWLLAALLFAFSKLFVVTDKIHRFIQIKLPIAAATIAILLAAFHFLW